MRLETSNVYPSILTFSEDGLLVRVVWEKDHELHRDNDLPALINYDNSIVRQVCYYENGYLNRDNGFPTTLVYSEKGFLLSVSWEKEHILHRENDLPARVKYYENNLVREVNWFYEGKAKRYNDLPTDVYYKSNGLLYREVWCDGDDFHRITGPSVIHYDKNNNVESEWYYLDDASVNKSEWLEDPRVKRILKNQSNGVLVSDVSL